MLPMLGRVRVAGLLVVVLFATFLAVGAAQGQSLVNGGVVTGAISVSGEQDSYTFSASAGQGIELRVVDSSGTSTFGPSVSLYNPSGTFVTFAQGQNVGAISVGALATGTYTVVVADGSTTHAGVGAYELYFVRAPGADEYGSLVNGGRHSETITLGDLDSYTFSATAGQGIVLRIADLSGTFFNPNVSLYGPTGGFVTQGQGLTVGRVELSAPTTGIYTVVVSDGSTTREGVGAYDLYFTLAPGAEEGGRLYDGSIRVDAIDLGDLDSYAFTATAGQAVQVTVTDTSGGPLFPSVYLYGPTGTFLTFASNASMAILHYTIPASGSGVYTLVVSDATTTGDATGSYSIGLTGAGGAPPVATLSIGPALMLLVLLVTIGLQAGFGRRVASASRAAISAPVPNPFSSTHVRFR